MGKKGGPPSFQAKRLSLKRKPKQSKAIAFFISLFLCSESDAFFRSLSNWKSCQETLSISHVHITHSLSFTMGISVKLSLKGILVISREMKRL